MYDIKNPIHYIAANRPGETIDVLTKKFGLAEPQSWDDLLTSIDWASQQYGESFVNEMAKIHPDIPQIIIATGLQARQLNYSNMIEDSYKDLLKGYSSDQLNAELGSLNSKLLNVGTADESGRSAILEKIKYVQEVLLKRVAASASPTAPAPATAGNNSLIDLMNTNKYLLLGLTALALIYIGSKLKITTA